MTALGTLLFVGSKPLGVAALRTASRTVGGRLVGIATLDDRGDTRSALDEFRATAQSLHIPLRFVDRSKDLTELVQTLRPDAVLVVGYYRIIDDVTLAIPRLGFAGAHASLLPRYRGNAPLVWALINGEQRSGVTLFRFGAGLDDGAIIDQVGFDLAPTDTIADALAKARDATVATVARSIEGFLDGTASLAPQNHAGASYCGLRRPEDGMIDWRWSATRIHDFVRAQSRPYPGAYALTESGGVIRIWRTAVFTSPFSGVPGVVDRATSEGVVVACGNGAVVVLDHELAGDGEPHAPVLGWGTRLTTARAGI